MALEDTLGLPPPDPQDQTASTPDQLAPSNELSIDPQTLSDRLSRKLGIEQAQAQAQLPPVDSEAVPGELPVDILDRITRDQWKKKQPAPEQPKQPSRKTPSNYADFGSDVGSPSVNYAQFGSDVTPPAPASPQGGGGDSASKEWSGYLPTIGKGLARGAAQGIGSILDYAPVESVAQGMAAGVMPGAEGMPTLGADDVAKQMQGVKVDRAGATIRKGIDQSIPMSKTEQESITGRVAQGVGGFLPVAAAAVAGGVPAAAGVMGLMAAAETYDAAKEKGASTDNALAAAGLSGAVNAALGAIPVAAVLKPIQAIAPSLEGTAVAALAKVGLSGRAGAVAQGAAQGAVAFAGIGEAQQYLGDAIARAFYDPNKHYDWDTNRVIASLLTGGIIGGIGHGLGYQAAPAAPTTAVGAPGAMPPPAGGAGPRPSGGPETGPSAGPQAGPGGVGPDFKFTSPGRRTILEKVAETFSGQFGDGHTAADIRGWSDADLFNYVREANARSSGAKPSEPPQPEQPKAEQPTPEQPQPQGANEAAQGETTTGPRPGTREKPIRVETPEDVLKAGEEVREPTPAQAEAENHKSGHVELPDLGFTGKNSVTIETPVGGTRRGPIDEKTGKPAWEVTNYPAAYGRVKGLKGADGMNLDVMVGPGGQNFVIDQNDPKTGKFDEHKIMAGWPSAEVAREAYLAAYDDKDGARIHAVTPITKDELWAHDWSKKQPYAKTDVKPETEQVSDEAKSGFDALNELFGGETTGGPSGKPTSTSAETPKPTETKLAEDNPTAEPVADLKAQLDDLSSAPHRSAVYVPKASLDHLAKMGIDIKEHVMSPHVLVEDFDKKGGAMVFRNKVTATVATTSRDHGTPMQQIIGNLTGAGMGKPADGTHVVQQRDVNDNVTRERLVREADLAATKQEFDTPDHLVKVLSPQEALKRRADLIAQELSAKNQPAEGEVTTGETGSDAHDHVSAIEDALTAQGIDPRNVNQADIRRAAEMLADGSATDPVDAFTRAVAENAIDQGYATQEEINDGFGQEIGQLLAGDEGGAPIHGGTAPSEGTTTGPRLTGGAEEGGEPSGGGEIGRNEGEGVQQGQVQPAEGQETKPEGGKPEGVVATEPVAEGTPTTTGPSGHGGGEGITTGPRGGVAEPERPERTDGESTGTTPSDTTGGDAGERTGDTGERPAVHEPAETPEPPVGGERGGEATEAETGGKGPETTGGERLTPEAEGEKPKIAQEAGEKLHGSRRDIWAMLHGKDEGITSDDLDNLSGAERAKFITKENVWKRPDYAALVADQGVEPIAAALLKRIYDRIPKQPIIPRYSNWTEAQSQEAYVKALRAIRGALTSAKTSADLRQAATDLDKAYKDQKIETTHVLAAALPAKEYYTSKNPAEYTRQDARIAEKMVSEGFPNQEPWQRIYTVGNRGKWDGEKHTYIRDDKGEIIYEWFVFRKSGSKAIDDAFATKDEAIAQAKKLYEEQGSSTEGGEIPERPHLDKLERSGPDLRKGVDIESGDSFIKEFGFRGSEFGNWVTSQGERQQMLNLAWDALHDLAYVTGLSPKAMSLDGTLGIAFGARGQGGKGAGAAHYEPVSRVINMTRINGAGSLAHELFGHAFDHYLGELDTKHRYEGAPKGISGWYEQPKETTYKDNYYRLQNLPEGLRKAANELMQALFYRPESTEEILTRLRGELDKDRAGIKNWDDAIAIVKANIANGRPEHAKLRRYEENRNLWVAQLNRNLAKLKSPEQYKSVVKTNYFKNAEKLSGKSGDYWKRPTEMFARAAEAYVFDKLKAHGRQNDYLVQGVEGDRFRSDGFGASGGGNYKGNPYPRGEERAAINLLFDELVKHLKSDTGKFEGSKVKASDYEGRGNADNVYDVIEMAKGQDVRDRLIAEAIALAGATEKAINRNLSDAFADHLSKEGFSNILAARKFASDRGFDMDAKKVEEELELGMVKLARQIVETNNSAADVTYAELTAAFDRQPKLGTRTSTSMRDQAYSTPIPLAYIASRLAGITPDSKVYEPTAGNGALLIEAKPTNVVANEINPARNENLQELGFQTTKVDAADDRPVPVKSQDVVIANPPFGVVDDGAGGKRTFDLGHYLKNYETNQIDHAIALRALDSMKDDGKAVLLVGSINKLNAEPDERFNAYQQANKRLFYKALYDGYNVVDHFTVDGDLWSKQGAQWPVDVIVISGRGKSALDLPAVSLPPVFKTWEQLKGLLNGSTSRELLQAAGATAGQTSGLGATGGHGGRGAGTTTGGGGRRPARPAEDEPVDIQSGADNAGAGTDQSGDGGRVQPGGGEDTGGLDLGADAEHPEQRPSGVVKASDEEINQAIADEIAALFGNDTTGTKASAFEPPPNEPQPPPKSEQAAPQFDEALYERAKPEFIKVAQNYPDLFTRMVELAKAVVRHLKTQYRWTQAQLDRMQPYLLRFIKDVQDGLVKLKRPKTERAVPGQHQVAYKPVADGSGMGTQAPANLAEAMDRGLRKIQAQVGPLTDYAVAELGIPKERLQSYLKAEQIDAFVQAIYNVKQNSAAINGDQTGIGKGRVGAMTAQWAHKNGKIPVFVTDNPALYADFYRDLKATGFLEYLQTKGIDKPRILTTDAIPKVFPLDDTTFLKRTTRADVDALMDKVPQPELVKDNYDLIFTSYPQLQMTGAKKEPRRRDFLRMVSPHAVYIFDESHNAAGEAEVQRGARPKVGEGPPPPNRAGFARELVQGASGVSYMSATYAKNPNAMVFYAKTNMRLAVSDPKELPKLFAKGGIPLQQVVAANLAEDAQYVRRERDYKGIDIRPVDIEVDKVQYDGITKSYGHINDLANFIKELLKTNKGLGAEIASTGSIAVDDNAVGEASVNATGFASILHNALAQMALAMKARPTAERAIEVLKRGEKPVLGLYNTMESFLSDYIETENEARLEKYREAKQHYEDGMIDKEPKQPELLGAGSPMTATFNDILTRYLERARTVRVKNANGEVQVVRLTDSQLGSQGVQLYNRAKGQIDSLTLIDMPISPIDAVTNDIKKAGYKINEISGRGWVIDYSGNVPKLAHRPASETGNTGKKKTVDLFNTKPENGGIDAIIMNQAGSTGLSMHASADFNDQSKRHMLLLQAPPDINIFMQMLGRINRTGQVVLPEYSLLFADVPSESRPAGLLMKKLASLNANTTGARGGAIDFEDMPDFMNQYGDEVATQFLLENPQYNRMMNYPLKIRDDGSYDIGDVMHRLTGKLALVYPWTKQGEILNHLTDEYNSLIEQKEAAGENMLEAKVLDLKARPIEGTEVVAAKADTDSRFGTSVIVHRAKVQRLVKPLSHKEIAHAIEKATGVEGLVGKTAKETANNLHLVESSSYDDPHRVKLREENDKALKEFAAFRRQELDAVEDPVQQEQTRVRLDRIKDVWQSLRNTLLPGTRWTLAMDDGNKTAIVLHLGHKGRAANPLALSTWQATFATAEGARQIAFPFSRLFLADASGQPTSPSSNLNAIDLRGRQNEYYSDTLERFESLQNLKHEQRYIATGNLLAALDWLDGKGRITHYTDYRGEIQQGIIAPHDFELQQHATQKGEPVQSAEELKEWLDKNRNRRNRTADGIISVGLDPSSYYRKNYEIQISANRNDGGVFFLDRELTNITGDFASKRVTVRKGGRDVATRVMAATVPEDRLLRALRRLMNLGADFRIDKGKRETFPIDTSDVPETETQAEGGGGEAPPPPEGGTAASGFIPDERPRLTPEAEARIGEIRNAVIKAVEHMLGKGAVEVRFAQMLDKTHPGWAGFTGGRLMGEFDATNNMVTVAIMLDRPDAMGDSTFHESFHAAQNLLINEQQRALLERETPRLRQFVGKEYPTMSPQTIEKLASYEVQAIAFQKYARDRANGGYGAGVHVGIRRIFEMLRNLFERIKNALRGLGFQRYQDIFSDLYEGKLAEQPRRTDKPLERAIKAETAKAASEGVKASAFMSDTADRVRERITELFPNRMRNNAVELLANYSHREKLLQREVEARFLGTTVEALGKWHPGISRLPDPMQFYVKKELMPGRMAHNATQFMRQYQKPFVKAAEDGKISLQEVGDYILAKGALQRNRKIAEAWREHPTHDFVKAMHDPDVVGGSGFSRNEAEDIIRRFESEPRAPYFREIWRRFQDIVEFDREMKISYGLESRAAVDAWRADGDAYAPYRGWEDAPDDAPEGYYPRAGSLGVRGPEQRAATGRKSKADNPAVTMMEQVFRTIDRGEKNIHYNSVAQAFAELKRNEVDISDIVRLNKVKTKRVIDRETGLVREVPDSSDRFSPNAVWFKRAGAPRVMVFTDRRVAESIKAAAPWQLKYGLQYALLGVNKLKSLWTHYSPDFAARHFLGRYLVEGVLNLQEFRDKPGNRVESLRWLREGAPELAATKVLRDIQNGKTPTGPLARYALEMQREGGSMAFRQMRDIDGIRNELSRALDDITGGKPVKNTLKAWRMLTKVTDDLFNVWDNATRLATYAQARRNGETPQQASFKAANATVNYRTGGLLSNWIGLVLPFNKIAVNTGVRMYGAMYRSPTMRRVIALTFAAGAALALWNYIMGGNDTDGIPFFEKVPAWDRHLNLIIMNPFLRDSKGRPMPHKLPMPFNYAFPLSAGYAVTGIALKAAGVLGKKAESIGDHLHHMVEAALSTFTTVAEGGNWLDSITPELAKVPVHLKTNTDWLGRPIHRDEAFQTGPNAYAGKTPIAGRVRTGEGWKDMAQFLNWATGGSRSKSGYIDMYPESLREAVSHPFGAQIRFGNEVRNTATSIMKGEPPKPTDVPLGRVFFGTDYDAANAAAAAKRADKARKPWKY